MNKPLLSILQNAPNAKFPLRNLVYRQKRPEQKQRNRTNQENQRKRNRPRTENANPPSIKKNKTQPVI